MKLLNLVENLILEEYQIEKLKEKYVGEPVEGEKYKRLSEKEFQDILGVTSGKFNLTAWLTIRVANDLIHTTDIYKFKEYFQIFEKNKNKFEIKDLNQYKTKEEINNFIQKCIEIRERNVQLTVGVDKESAENYATPKEIEKLESVGIQYMGMSDGYQVFEIPNEVKDNKETWKVYRDILGRCAGREQGATVDICTIGGFEHFQYYMKKYGGSYFLLFNMGDPQSPYQIHFESNQFMDRKDNQQL
jgi:hypothetical protein